MSQLSDTQHDDIHAEDDRVTEEGLVQTSEELEELDLDDGWREPLDEPSVIVDLPPEPAAPPELPGDAFPVQSLEEMSGELGDHTGWAEEILGQTFGGRFRLERELARGGMGVVYHGTQLNLDRPVVVKVISKAFVDGPEDIARFKLEARGLSKLQHPNIVTIHDYGTEGGLSYIVMEHIDGETLKDRMDRYGGLDMPVFIRVAQQILRAFGEAHDRGIIHRDIKPANVMLTERNHQADFVKVVDFGLAKLADSTEDITGKGLVGTFAYVSPEQILAEPFDARSDVYSLGVLFYHMLAGQKPFDDPDGMAVLYKHVNDAPPPLQSVLPRPDDIPERLIEVIHRCLEKDPARRPRDAGELLACLIEKGVFPADDASGPRGPQFQSWVPEEKEAVRQPRTAAVGFAAGLLIFLVGLVWFFIQPRTEQPEPTPASVAVAEGDAPDAGADASAALAAALPDAVDAAYETAAEEAAQLLASDRRAVAVQLAELPQPVKAVAVKKDEPKPKPKPAKAEPAPKVATKSTSVAQPRLPSTVRLQDRRMLERMLRRVEGEVIDRNKFSPVQVQNVTHKLFKAIDADIRSSKAPAVSPRTIYYEIARGLDAGRTRAQIADTLAAKYGSGAFK